MRSTLLLCFTLPIFVLAVSARTAAQQTQRACGSPPAILQSTAPNIFSEQQEQWLGEAMADYTDANYRPIKNAEQNAYLGTIGARLLAVLPPTGIQFHYTLVESSEVNGFSLAGGRVYLTRKLVASARSEDEVAGVIAHEMGHILSHQFAVETTADLRRLLGVTSVTDRADIYAKFQRLVDARLHDKHPIDSDSDDKQDEADRVAVYAAAAAGYRPQAYAEFWDRSFFVGGKTGNRLTDFFDGTTPTQKRLRRIRGLLAELPSGCGATTETASASFQHWQHEVLEDQPAPVPTKLSETEIELTPPLRLDIEHLRFSRDGKYVLAQDESSVIVLSRDPFKELFRFDADRALPADFTPDSQQIAFATRGLHVELWSIAQQKLVAAHEIVAQQSCIQTMLSPDARTITCVGDGDDGLALDLIDVESGHVVFEKKPWFQPNYSFELALFMRRLTNDPTDILTSSLSADGNTLIIGPGTERLAFDLRTRTPIKISGALKSSDFAVSYSFIGNDAIAAINSGSPEHSGTFGFPAGQRLKQFKLNLDSIHSTTGGQYVTSAGPKDIAAAVVDLDAGRFVFATRTPALDVIGSAVVSENLGGSLLLSKIGSDDPKDRARAILPLSPLAPTRAAALSPDGRYLALSARTRGSLWDLATGKQILLARGFSSPWWTADGKLIAEFPEFDKSPRTVGEIAVSPLHLRNLPYKLPEKAHLEIGHLIEWKPEKKGYTLTLYSPADLSVQWTRTFAEGRPGYTTNSDDTDLIFSDLLQSSPAKEKLRSDNTLKAQASAVKEKSAGRLIEIVNSADGTTRASVVIEVPRTYDGVDGFNRVGDLLYLSTGDNRTIVYSLKTGSQLRQIFGYLVAADHTTENICFTNRRNEAIVLDKSGAELQHLTLASPLRYAQLREHGTQLLTVTADQRVRRFTIPSTKMATNTPQ